MEIDYDNFQVELEFRDLEATVFDVSSHRVFIQFFFCGKFDLNETIRQTGELMFTEVYHFVKYI